MFILIGTSQVSVTLALFFLILLFNQTNNKRELVYICCLNGVYYAYNVQVKLSQK